jgi:hypothetical protein
MLVLLLQTPWGATLALLSCLQEASVSFIQEASVSFIQRQPCQSFHDFQCGSVLGACPRAGRGLLRTVLGASGRQAGKVEGWFAYLQ